MISSKAIRKLAFVQILIILIILTTKVQSISVPMSSCIKYKYPVEVKHSQASQINVMTSSQNYLYAAGITHDKVLTQSSDLEVAFFMKVQQDDASIVFIKAVPNIRLFSLAIYVKPDSYMVTLVYNPALEKSGFLLLDMNNGTLFNLFYSDILRSANALSMRNGCFIVDTDGTLLLVHTDYSSSSQYISVLQFKPSTDGDPLSGYQQAQAFKSLISDTGNRGLFARIINQTPMIVGTCNVYPITTSKQSLFIMPIEYNGDPSVRESIFIEQSSSGNFVLELYDGMYDVDES
eukprot:403344761